MRRRQLISVDVQLEPSQSDESEREPDNRIGLELAESLAKLALFIGSLSCGTRSDGCPSALGYWACALF